MQFWVTGSVSVGNKVVGSNVGIAVGCKVGSIVGCTLLSPVGSRVGSEVVGVVVGSTVLYNQSQCLNIQRRKNIQITARDTCAPS